MREMRRMLWINTCLLVSLASQLTDAYMPSAINIRLVDGPDPSQGRIEIQSADGDVNRNPWGTICNDMYEMNNRAATVVCRQLGYLWGEGTPNGKFGSAPKSMAILLDELMCNGTESSITECYNSGWSNHNCYHHEDVGAICHNKTVRLQTPSLRPDVGAVQVLHNYKWADACDTGWNDKAANLTCKELGYQQGVPECCSALGPSQFSNVDVSFTYNCTGPETSLDECQQNSYRGMCDYSHRASVVCHNKHNIDTDFAVRLTGGDSYWGRVEVRHSGIWGQVCNDKWRDEAANVTCRELGRGFIGGVALGPVQRSVLPFWLVDVTCSGTENSLANCTYTQWGEPLLFPCRAAYVLCYKTTGLQIDIVDGILSSMGRVQITYDGQPGSVCTDEWTNNDAYIVCKMKGYADGAVKVPDTDAPGQPFYLTWLICSKPVSLFMCSSRGWRRQTKTCTSRAHVMCYKQVRLAGGSPSAGVVEVFDGNRWVGLCGLGFNGDSASLVCRELGYATGSQLAMGSYGKYRGTLVRPYLACKGNETSIMDCGYYKQGNCTSVQHKYAAVSCHKDEPDSGIQYRLYGDQPDSSYGRVDVYVNHTWGSVCAAGWGDTEAGVFCKTRGSGYIGGVAMYYMQRSSVPVLVSGIKCMGNETSFETCLVADYSICWTSLRAGIVCYKESAPTAIIAREALADRKEIDDGSNCGWMQINSDGNHYYLVCDMPCNRFTLSLPPTASVSVVDAPTVSIVDGGSNYGRVQISSDGTRGSVCDMSWTETEASVVCRELNKNFTQGEPYSQFPKAASDVGVVLANTDCIGLEDSLLECSHSGWMAVVRTACLDHSYDVGVYCYGRVRVMDGHKSKDILTGRVEVLSATNNKDWIPVCGDGFDQVDADVVCKDMGFDIAKVLAPGSFGVKHLWKLYLNMTCTEGASDVRSDCTFDTHGVCSMSTHNYASVMCYRSQANPEAKYFIEYGSNGRVTVQQYGINGTICLDGWDNRDASVVCRQKGYRGGVVLGVPEIYTRTMPIWFTNFRCTGREAGLNDCIKTETVGMQCATSLKAAGVLCYQSTGVSLRLVNKDGANYYGRVEVTVDGKSGTVCDYDWSTYDARVTCRQLGFPDGEPNWKSYYGPGNGSVFLSGMTCNSSESTLLECPNIGWETVQSTCLSHKRDAGVMCKRNVMTEQGKMYGAVKVWRDDKYYLVCADGFSDRDAHVVCKTMGYPFGKSLCCSAFGQPSTKIGFSRSMCTGRETNYNDCRKTLDGGACASSQYASVVCSKSEPTKDIYFGITEFQPGMGSGTVAVDYMDRRGYMCAEDFDDKDANVLCKQRGFAGGYSYKYLNTDVRQRATVDLRWLRGPACTGFEHRLDMCKGIHVGNVSGCFVLSHAAVFCYRSKERSEFSVQLANSPHPGEGYVQVKVNGTWGTVCTRGTLISNFEATVICRQKNFKYGIELPIPSYPRVNGTVWITNINCVGNETTVRDCLLSGMGDNVSDPCLTHGYDMAVKCYTDVRVSASKIPSYGMVQVLNETANRWVSVCDTGFDDLDARVVCKSIGYQDGKAQCCSSMGPRLTVYNPIEVANVRCSGNEESFSQCKKDMSINVTCPSGNYASVICSDSNPIVEDLQVAIADNKHYGNVEVRRYGVKGSVCDVNWDNADANVLCRQLGFAIGYATNGSNTGEDPMVLTSVNCTGNETSMAQCSYPPLSKGHECNSRRTRAAVLCSMDKEPVRYRVADMHDDRGRAEVYINGQWGTICDLYWEDKDADVFCRQVGYLYGESTVLIQRGSNDTPIWMSTVECTGKETDFLQCRASWDRKSTSRCSHYDDAGVKCYRSARLNRGDYRTKRTNGIVEIFVPQPDPFSSSWYTVCADTFTDKEAEVVCRVLGHEHGLAVCCSPYGYNTSPMTKFRPQCNGTEGQITECQYVRNNTQCNRQSYAAVTCYNGTRSQTSYSVGLKGSLQYTGQVVLTYMGVPGRICWKGWDDADARVVCRELGFKNGSAYYHYKSSFIYLYYNGPYWTSDVQCTGNERRLKDCPHTGFGNVSNCDDKGHYAGVICFDDTDIAYRISGGESYYGRVEFSYENQWNTICSKSWGYQEANVTCKQLGFITGDPYSGKYKTKPSGKAYTIDFRCTGMEKNLNACPHEGIQEALYCDYKDDEGVFCYTSVKLSGEQDTNSNVGTVLYYHDEKWKLVCDDGFDDVTARRVCRELGFAEGKAICCSAFGKVYEDMMTNNTLHCTGDEQSIDQCLRDKPCNSTYYASAICFKSMDVIDDEYTFDIAKTNKGQIEVTHFGVKGRICSNRWDDKEATVFCRGQGFINGIAYQHSESNVLQEVRGPYWLGGFNCTGSETTLMECPHTDRTNLGNCTGSDIAAVLCFNGSGIQYRMAPSGENYGRVEISIGGKWGTVCDEFWDRREASVFCRQLNYTDGEAIGSAHFGEGRGPIWLSHLECKGTENNLHQCPHRGFANEFSYDWWFPLPCETHADDAGVFCYKSVRLNNGPTSRSGGLEVHNNGSWYGVCDTNFDHKSALVACRSINHDFVDARAIPGSSYGNLSGPILFSHVACVGSETSLTDCPMKTNTTCTSGHYVSVYCSNSPIQDDGFALRLAPDSLASNLHGILEVRVNGVWGRVCLHNFNDTDASVACQHLGHEGGVAYLHIMKNDRPILLRDVNCKGTESRLEQCTNQRSPDLQNCHYGSKEAGVICYNKTNNIGFQYRLAGRSNPSTGRVEIGYAGRWGLVCAWSWQTADAKVLCRSLGYKDGIVNYTVNSDLRYSRPWVTGFFCQGDEPSPMTCLNTGFNSTFLTDLCQTDRDPGAYTQCFRELVAPTSIRLIGGRNNYTGRVEVFVTGANAWGTICDDYWDDDDATVVCRQLGLYGGSALRRAPYGSGTGPIWFDNVKCFGNESSLFNCSHRGIGTHNCNHTEDVGVICEPTPPTTPLPPSTVKPTTAVVTTSTVPSTSTGFTTSTSTTTMSTSTTTTPKPVITTPSTTTSTTTISTTSKRPTTPTTLKTTSTTTSTTESTTTSTTTQSTTTSTTTSTSTTTKTTSSTTTQTPTKQTTVPTTEEITSTISTTMSTETNKTAQAQLTATSKANIGVFVGIPIAVIVLLAIVIALVLFIRMRRSKPQGYTREPLDDSIIIRDPDGTISASNQLYDLDLQPSSPNGFSDISADADTMRLNKSGNAYYSRGVVDPNNTVGSFSNPLYEANKDLDLTEGHNNVGNGMASTSEITLPRGHFDSHGDHSNA